MSPLTPLEVARFLDLGYLILDLNDVEDSIHDRIFNTCETLYKGMANMPDSSTGFNLIADDINTNVPELGELLNSSQLNGALTTLLGRKHFRYNHSYIHRSSSRDQSFHKDSGLPWGTRNGIRSHRLNWAMVFYYPQKTTVELGATEILPGTQYWSVDREQPGATAGEDRLDLQFETDGVNSDPDLGVRDARLRQNVMDFDEQTEPIRLEIPKGSVVLVHFDLFHRGTRQLVDGSRYMLKFWYLRTVEPEDLFESSCVSYMCTDPRRESIVSACLDWLKIPVQVQQSKPTIGASESSGDAELVARAYQLARRQDIELLRDFISENEAIRRAATQALTTTGCFGLDTALDNTLSDSPPIRMSGAFLLGEIAEPQEKIVDVLCHLVIEDHETDVRVTAINSLGRLVRRNNDLDCSTFQYIVQRLLDVISNSKMRPSRRLPMACPTRQAAYVAILCAISSISLTRHAATLSLLAEYLDSSISKERDRYAKGTAVEIVCRLAHFGISSATECVVRLLRNERVNSLVQHA